MVLIDREDKKVTPGTFELLAMGEKLQGKLGERLIAAIIGYEVSSILQDIAYFAEDVYFTDNPLLRDFHAEIYADVLGKLCREIKPKIILLNHSLDNLDLAPRLSYKMDAQLITDCIDISIDLEKGFLLCAKPVYGGNAIAVFKMERMPQIATLRRKVIEPMERVSHKGNTIKFDVDIDESPVKVESLERVTVEIVQLDKADAIVAAGRGIREREGLRELEELAKVLKQFFPNVELGASRPIIDRGWLPSSRQVGLTGEKVSPQLYIAVGISGASQHIAGITSSKKIVAINTDPEANIFKVANYGVVGKYEEVVPAFTRKLQELP